MSFNSNNTNYAIVTDAELGTILTYFNREQIMNTLENTLLSIYRPTPQIIPNLIMSLEQHFVLRKQQYPSLEKDLNSLREEIYNDIIRRLCSFFNFEYNIQNKDIYTVAFYMYKFLVSEFTLNNVNFFVKYIIKESKPLYSRLNLIDNKRNKDSSTLYSKKVFADTELGIIFANLESVLKDICVYDVTVYDIINIIYGFNNQEGDFIKGIIMDKGNFYKQFFVHNILSENTFSTSLTMIKLGIQSEAIIVDVTINKEEEEN